MLRLPEICRFCGVIIRMFAEPDERHHGAYIHAYCQDRAAVFSIDGVEVIGGSLPRRERRLVEAWAELHLGELVENCQRLQSGRAPYEIAPLR